MLLRHPKTVRWRQAAPPLFVAGLLGLSAGALLAAPARVALALVFVAYGSTLTGAGIHAAVVRRDPGLAAGLPLAIATIHLSWGSGFLWSAASHLIERRLPERIVPS
jgi:hypothetical protein